MRLSFLVILVSFFSLAHSQLQVNELTLEPTKEDSSIYLFQTLYADHLKSKSTPIILYFCPIRNYSKEEYSEKISLLKNSPFLKNLKQRVDLHLYFFVENEVNDKSGIQYQPGKWINESTCFFLHFEPSNLERIAANFPREYKIEKTSDLSSTKVILFDANRCFPDVPTRLVAYARAIQECAQPAYTDSEVNQFQSEDIDELKKEIKNSKNEIDENTKNNASQSEQLFELNLRQNNTIGKIDTLQTNLSDADILLHAFGSIQPDFGEGNVAVRDAFGSGWSVGFRKLIPSLSSKLLNFYATFGVSLANQQATISRDSIHIMSEAVDVNGVNYNRHDYYSNATERLHASSMAIPLGIQLHFTPSALKKIKVVLETGAQALFIQQAQSQIVGGSLSTTGTYQGFDQEISNVASLGFIENQQINGNTNTQLLRDHAMSGYAGLQIELRISHLLSLCLHSRYQYSSNLLTNDKDPLSFDPSSGLLAYRLNPYQFGLGLSYSFKP